MGGSPRGPGTPSSYRPSSGRSATPATSCPRTPQYKERPSKGDLRCSAAARVRQGETVRKRDRREERVEAAGGRPLGGTCRTRRVEGWPNQLRPSLKCCGAGVNIHSGVGLCGFACRGDNGVGTAPMTETSWRQSPVLYDAPPQKKAFLIDVHAEFQFNLQEECGWILLLAQKSLLFFSEGSSASASPIAATAPIVTNWE